MALLRKIQNMIRLIDGDLPDGEYHVHPEHRVSTPAPDDKPAKPAKPAKVHKVASK